MKRTAYFIVVLIGCASMIFIFNHYHAKKANYLQVVNRQGYTLKMTQEPVPIQLLLEPKWLNEEGTWNFKLLEKANTSFILKRTETLNGGLTFTIVILPKMERFTGTFLSNRVYEEVGGYHYYAKAPLWKIYDQDGRQLDIDVIANGQGDRQFSFTLSKEDLEEAAESASQGLDVQYNGIVLYEYDRT